MPNPSCWPFQWWRGLPWGHCTAFLFRELWAQPATLWTGAVHAIGHAAVGGHGAFLLGYGNPWLRWEMIKPKMADLVGGIRKSVGIIIPGKKTCSKAPTRDFPIATLVYWGVHHGVREMCCYIGPQQDASVRSRNQQPIQNQITSWSGSSSLDLLQRLQTNT
jgi:hypothetical protein